MSQCTETADVEGETVRCWQQAGHEYSHISPDGVHWIGPETPASAPLLDADAVEVQRRPENLSDDYGPFNTYTRTVAYMQAVRAQLNPTWVDITAEVELAALKARRCDGCAHWKSYRHNGQTYGDCEEPNVYAVYAWTPIGTPADHACNAWQPKPDPQAPKVDA